MVDETEKIRCIEYDGGWYNADRNNGGRLWPYINWHSDGKSPVGHWEKRRTQWATYENVWVTDYQPAQAMKRGRRIQTTGCCGECQPCPCVCALDVKNCLELKPVSISIKCLVSLDWANAGTFPDDVVAKINAVAKACSDGAADMECYPPGYAVNSCGCPFEGGINGISWIGTHGFPSSSFPVGEVRAHLCVAPDDETKKVWYVEYGNAGWSTLYGYQAPWTYTGYATAGSYMPGGGYTNKFDCEDHHATFSTQTVYENAAAGYYDRNSGMQYDCPGWLTYVVNIGWGTRGLTIAPATIQAKLEGVVPCGKETAKTHNIIKAGIEDAQLRGWVTLPNRSACAYTSQLYPVPGFQGGYYYYSASPAQSTAFPWGNNLQTTKCSSKWSANFNICTLALKQAIVVDENEMPIMPLRYQICGCLDGSTFAVAGGEVDSGFLGQYSCTKIPTFIPNLPVMVDDPAYPPDSGHKIPGCEIPFPPPRGCKRCDCCGNGMYAVGRGGGIWLR